jgi:hypothetical protein
MYDRLPVPLRQHRRGERRRYLDRILVTGHVTARGTNTETRQVNTQRAAGVFRAQCPCRWTLALALVAGHGGVPGPLRPGARPQGKARKPDPAPLRAPPLAIGPAAHEDAEDRPGPRGAAKNLGKLEPPAGAASGSRSRSRGRRRAAGGGGATPRVAARARRAYAESRIGRIMRRIICTMDLRKLHTDPQIPESRPAPPRFGRENGRDFPDPDWAGIGNILGILPRSRFGRDPGKSGNPDLAGIGEKAGICQCASINRDQDRDRQLARWGASRC